MTSAVKYLLVFALACLAVSAVAASYISLNETRTVTNSFLTDNTSNTIPSFVLTGDPVGGGGTPNGGTQPFNQTS